MRKEIALLKKPYSERNVEEKKKLARTMLKLDCFSRFHPRTRISAAKYVEYLYYNSGRLLTREGDPATGMYFILDGEVIQSIKEFDTVKNQFVDVDIAVLGSGDIFGEFALIENVKRPVSTKSSSNVELLAVYDEEFLAILKPELHLEWSQKETAFDTITYFSKWDASQMYLGCKLSLISEYKPLQTIYSEDQGVLNPVFFVLSGQCMILQCLKLKVKIVNGRKVYSLLDESHERSKDTKYLPLHRIFSKRQAAIKEDEKMQREKEQTQQPINIELNEEIMKKENEQIDHPEMILRDVKSIIKSHIFAMRKDDDKSDIKKLSESLISAQVMGDEENFVIEDHFVDVGTMGAGSIFGLGETMLHRAIIANSTVQCLQIPRYWLFEKSQNPGNMWQRLKFHLNATIPSREELFKDFLTTQKWNKYKKDIIQSSIDVTKSNNPTKIDDIPIICRIIEGIN